MSEESQTPDVAAAADKVRAAAEESAAAAAAAAAADATPEPEPEPMPSWAQAEADEPPPAEPSAGAPAGEDWEAGLAGTGAALAERPEVLVGAAFAGGLVTAMILRRLAR